MLEESISINLDALRVSKEAASMGRCRLGWCAWASYAALRALRNAESYAPFATISERYLEDVAERTRIHSEAPTVKRETSTMDNPARRPRFARGHRRERTRVTLATWSNNALIGVQMLASVPPR